MKNLTITYGNTTLFDGEVQEITWTDSENSISVTGKLKSAASNGQGFLDLIAAVAKQRTEGEVAQRKDALEQEKQQIAVAE